MSRDLLLFLAVFLACGVEGVEAVTIVLAVGITRGWRSAAAGVAAALVVLALVVAVLGPTLTSLPIDTLRLVVGGLLLVFGLQWLRKAILRASGYKALHDEDAIFAAEVAAARAAGAEPGRVDAYGFTISFKGVLLEGLEVAFIVVTLGGNGKNLPLAAAAAVAAIAVVVAAGALAHRPLSRVPENTLKFAVGVMLTSFGTFWGAEGAGASWPGQDAALPVLIAFTLVSSLLLVRMLRHRHARIPAPAPREAAGMSRLRAILAFAYDFFVGDDPLIVLGIVAALGITAVVAETDLAAWWILPPTAMAALAVSLLRATRP